MAGETQIRVASPTRAFIEDTRGLLRRLVKWAGAGMTLLILTSARAGLYTAAFTDISLTIPDANPVGVMFAGSVTNVPSGWIVSGVTVQLNITNGYNGDLYGYLVAPNGTLVRLLNRPGTGLIPFGASGPGMNITLQDGTTDHGPIQDETTSSFLIGSYNADQSMAGFNGSLADGAWTLFMADLSGGGTGVLNSLTLNITATAAPVTVTLARHSGPAIRPPMAIP